MAQTLLTSPGSFIDGAGNVWSLKPARDGCLAFCNRLPAGLDSVSSLLFDGIDIFGCSLGQWHIHQLGAWVPVSSSPLPASDSLRIDFTQPSGGRVEKSAFGFTLSADALDALSDSRFQASLTEIGGIGFIRLMFGADILLSVYPTRYHALTQTPDWTVLEAICQGLSAIPYGTLAIQLGRPAPWLQLAVPDDQTIYAEMAVAIADYFAIQGHRCQYWECLTTPDLTAEIEVAAEVAQAAAAALKHYDESYKIGGPDLASNPLFRSDDFRSWRAKFSADFASYRYFSYATPENNVSDLAIIRNAVSGKNAAGAVLDQVKTMADDQPCLMIYNIDAVPSTDESRQATNVGAVFQSACIVDAVRNGLEMGSVWRGLDATTCFGIFDATSLRPYAPAYALGELYRCLPGNIVRSAISNTGLKIIHMATKSTQGATICLINYDCSPVAVNLLINGFDWPAQSSYFEVSADHAGLRKSLSILDLRNLSVPAMSVVILNAT